MQNLGSQEEDVKQPGKLVKIIDMIYDQGGPSKRPPESLPTYPYLSSYTLGLVNAS